MGPNNLRWVCNIRFSPITGTLYIIRVYHIVVVGKLLWAVWQCPPHFLSQPFGSDQVTHVTFSSSFILLLFYILSANGNCFWILKSAPLTQKWSVLGKNTVYVSRTPCY